MFRRKIEAQVYLPEVFEFERKNWSCQAMSLAQRFEFCLHAFSDIRQRLNQDQIPECIGLHGTIVNISDKGTLNVTLGATKLPTTTDVNILNALSKVIISPITVPGTPTDKITVQLLGQLFLNIFRIIWDANKDVQLQEKTKLFSEGTLPFNNCFQIGFRDNIRDTKYNSGDIRTCYDYIDSDTAASLTALLAKMNCINPDVCPTFENAFNEFLSITTKAKLISVDNKKTVALLLPANINSIINKHNTTPASAASAAASVSASLSASCTLFSSMNVSCDDLVTSRPISDNNRQKAAKH